MRVPAGFQTKEGRESSQVFRCSGHPDPVVLYDDAYGPRRCRDVECAERPRIRIGINCPALAGKLLARHEAFDFVCERGEFSRLSGNV